MYAVRLQRDLKILREHVKWAIEHDASMTLTYRELAKDADGKRIVSRIPEHQEYEIIVRTIEPYSIETNAQGDLYMRTLDRIGMDEPAYRSYRLDRVLLYTRHRANTRVLNHQENEVLANA